jgi:RNA polymerase sigma-70 factor (ECF subfamily)
MENDVDCVRLVKQAQLGDTGSLERLAALAAESLRENVYRMTLEEELTQDIVQETVLEMLKIFGELKEADRFWPWVYKIALNKLRLHRRAERLRSTAPISAAGSVAEEKNGRDAMSALAAKELKQIIFGAMGRLKAEHRAVLTMRCYKEMEYAAIAEAIGCTEFAARKQFWRAKKALQRQLAHEGFGRGSLLMALVLFGKMTATSEAAAAKVSVTGGATKVGAMAALAGLAGTKTAIISLVTAATVGAGAVAVTSGVKGPADVTGDNSMAITRSAERPVDAGRSSGEYWYLFPEGRDGPMMARLMQGGSCRWMQDGEGNYFFDRGKNAVCVNNYRQWRGDLSVWRLPTDSPQLRQFLASVEGRAEQMGYVTGDGPGLLAVVTPSKNGRSFWQTRHENILNEEYFRYSWPAGVELVDNRDTMHRRGWTYFKISGEISGEMVLGSGRIPFVYDAAGENWAWMKISLGNREIVDTHLAGFSRPWMGLHTIDTVRRDAAGQQMRFETKLEPGEEKAEVVVYAGQAKLVYTIDMEADVVEQIRITSADGNQARLRFTYLQEIDGVRNEFIEPRVSRYYGDKREQGLTWLLDLVNGDW